MSRQSLLVQTAQPIFSSTAGRLPCEGRPTSVRILRGLYLFYKIVLMASLKIGSLELATMLAVARLGDEAYGLAVRADLDERTERAHSVGAVYTTLQRLEAKGFLSSNASEPIPVRGGRSRRHFTITRAGATALREAERSSVALWMGIGAPHAPRFA